MGFNGFPGFSEMGQDYTDYRITETRQPDRLM